MPTAADTPRRNVLLIVTDQQRYDSMGCTGDANALTPNLDALAAGACVYDRHFTANPVCMPSRASAMTGCYPAAHGVWTNGIALPRAAHVPVTEQTRNILANHWSDPSQKPPIPSHLPTIADHFSAAGYATDAIGKLHLTPLASDPALGYEECVKRWADDPAGRAAWHGPYYGFTHVECATHHGTDAGGHYPAWLDANYPGLRDALAAEQRDAPRPTVLRDLYASRVHTRASHPTTWVARRVAERIEQHAKAGRPFFLWAGIPDPHHPFAPPADVLAEQEGRAVTPRAADPATAGDEPRWVTQARGGADLIDAETSQTARRYTNAQIALIDEAVGTMIDALKSAGQWENTVVVFTSDHGDYLGDYGLIRKTLDPCRVLNQTPLIIRTPGDPPARCPTPASNVDLLPTLAAAVGLDAPAGVQGEDLAVVRETGRRGLPVMVQAGNGLPLATSVSMLDADHRTTWWPNVDRVECFDHAADPMELRDLGAGGRDSPEVADRFALLQHSFGRTVRPTIGRVSPW